MEHVVIIGAGPAGISAAHVQPEEIWILVIHTGDRSP